MQSILSTFVLLIATATALPQFGPQYRFYQISPNHENLIPLPSAQYPSSSLSAPEALPLTQSSTYAPVTDAPTAAPAPAHTPMRMSSYPTYNQQSSQNQAQAQAQAQPQAQAQAQQSPSMASNSANAQYGAGKPLPVSPVNAGYPTYSFPPVTPEDQEFLNYFGGLSASKVMNTISKVAASQASELSAGQSPCSSDGRSVTIDNLKITPDSLLQIAKLAQTFGTNPNWRRMKLGEMKQALELTEGLAPQAFSGVRSSGLSHPQ